MSIRLSRTRVIAVIIAVIVIAIGGAAAVARLWPVQSHRQITVDYPREGALFPPDFAPPTLEAGRSGEALPLLKQAVESNPGDAAVHNDYGCALVSEGHVAEAIAQFRVAIGLSQDYPDAHNNLASALAQIGQADDAGSEFRKALALRPDYPEAQAGLGTLLTLGGRFSEGIPLLLKSVQGRPQSLTARMGLAIALSESGRPQEALPHAREAVALSNGQNAEILELLGRLYAQTGATADAIAWTRKALDMAAQAGDQQLVAELRAQLASYEASAPRLR